MMALETKMTPNFSNLLQTQHRGYAQMLQTFDGRVQEHEALTGVHPITGKTTNKRKRGETSMVGSPMNAFEETLIACCDASNVLRDNVATERFLPLLNQAKTESDQAKLLCVLAATAKVPERLSSVDQFESFGGVKVARQWLDKAVSYRQTSLLHFILVTLKELPLQLSSITDAKINEPDLLKHWKTTFTEKPAPIAKESTSPPSKGGAKAKAAAGGGDLLGKLLLKKQEANKVINKPKDSFVTKMVQNSQQLKKDAAAAAAAAPAVSSPVALPTIARFDQVQSQLPSAAPSSRRIKWADEHGSELTKIKLIESWRDLIMHNEKDDPSSPMVTGGTFKDAKLREHANEKFALQNKHKEESSRSRAVAIPTVSWRTPPTLQLPEGVTPRFTEETNETMAQTNRTRKDMEWMILGDEVPPPNPQEWVRTPAELSLGPTATIPLSDPNEMPQPVASPPSVVSSIQSANEASLLQALGPLEKSTLSLLSSASDVAMTQVFAEAQRNGRRISDARVVDILNQYRRGTPPLLSNPPPHNASRLPPNASAPPHVSAPSQLNAPPLLSNPGYVGGRDGPSGPPPYGGNGGGGYGPPSSSNSGGGGYGPPGANNNGFNTPNSGAPFNGPYKPPPSTYGAPPPQSFNAPNNGYNAPHGGGYGGYQDRGARDSGYLGEGYGYGAGGGYPDEHRYSDPSQRYADDGPRFNKRNPHESGMPDMSYPSKRPAFALPHGGGGGPGSYKYKQVPCIYFNSPAGCGKGEACTFIHDEDARGAGGVAASKYAPRGGHGPPPFKGGGPKPNYYGGGGGRGGAFR
ncbi:hypothetical protein, variant [Aphanomyces invadans]|uniref:C3H1-type domain-containing protein n=1 Tax=Aphanomyces invadans TaxID=157072 RepID=A0A024UKC2_9STRA|nr:hypothetical protein, variant [Aphanomyces invadans]ETW06058.1 hypothetical protein, variant [Aphanomyces invadans]|eukprot:XP_008865835.1 hypothetical protein, variant [Aphanomyces invadans]